MPPRSMRKDPKKGAKVTSKTNAAARTNLAEQNGEDHSAINQEVSIPNYIEYFTKYHQTGF